MSGVVWVQKQRIEHQPLKAMLHTPPDNRDKIYLKLNMDLEREYFRNKIPDEIQLLSRNQRSLALHVGRGEARALTS